LNAIAAQLRHQESASSTRKQTQAPLTAGKTNESVFCCRSGVGKSGARFWQLMSDPALQKVRLRVACDTRGELTVSLQAAQAMVALKKHQEEAEKLVDGLEAAWNPRKRSLFFSLEPRSRPRGGRDGRRGTDKSGVCGGPRV
jgi:hypothetical protein